LASHSFEPLMSELSDARHRTRDHPACAVPPNAVAVLISWQI
jgi:hypothetical protein